MNGLIQLKNVEDTEHHKDVLELIDKIDVKIEEFKVDEHKVFMYRSCGRRARKRTVEIARLFKQFRLLTIEKGL